VNEPAAPKARRFDREVDGILLLDKPPGMSSNTALQRARAIFRALKAGHAGSLDPMATGVLPVCFGEATKVCSFLLDARKSYRFTAKLGERTDTGDADGIVVERQTVPLLTEAQVAAVLQGSLGEQRQVPPMYSALKHQGQRLYELARRGEEVVREPRRIVIEALDLQRLASPEIELTVRCSKGTYVRTLAEDLAAKLGTVCHLVALRREQVEPFTEKPRTLEELDASAPQTPEQGWQALDALLRPADCALAQLPAVMLDLPRQQALLQGQAVLGADLTPGQVAGWVRLYGGGAFLGVGELCQGKVLPRRLWKR
jgi:tRNA pseudouridine55 synthase